VNVDEIIADVRDALGLTDDQVLVNVVVLGEYVDLDPAAESPERRRMAMTSSDELEPWTSIGMLEFAKMREHRAVLDLDDE
jgi:hypothetical protein